jgi:hypothetical protein
MGLIQKYRLDHDHLIAEGDVATELMLKNGLPVQSWRSIINNYTDILAVLASVTANQTAVFPA